MSSDCSSSLYAILDSHAGESFAGGEASIHVAGRERGRAAAGARQIHGADVPHPLAFGTTFDLASTTKVLVTTAALMVLTAEGRVHLDDPVARWIPEVAPEITVGHLLAHRAGLWEWWPLYASVSGWDDAVGAAAGLTLRYPVGAARRYSDLGMILAGEVARRAADEDLRSFATNRVLEPLGLALTLGSASGEVAATSLGDDYERSMLATQEPFPVGVGPEAFEGWRSHVLVGETADCNAFHAFGGFAPHAGAFGTVDDVARFGEALLEGCLGPLDAFVGDCSPGRGLGFWTGLLDELGLGSGGFGHPGFTGCRFLVVPERELVAVLLTNRTHRPHPYPDIEPAWRAVVEVALAEA